MKQINLILLFLVVCSACQKSTPSVDSFELVTEIIDYDSIYSDKNDILGEITRMGIAGNTLILRNSNDTYHFSLIDINKGVLLDRWGKRGNGPNEYVQISSDFDVSGDSLIFLDTAKKEINYVSISSLLDKNDTTCITKIPYPYVVDFRPRFINVVADKKIAVGSFKDEGRFGVTDSKNNILPSPFKNPFSYDEITGIYVGSTFQSNIKSNYKQHRFVISTLSSDIFDIYEVSDSNIRRVYMSPFNHAPEIRAKPGRLPNYGVDYDKSIAGLTSMTVSEEYICFLYSSLGYAEFTDSGIGSKEVLCFNWNGDKVRKYILPFPVDCICVEDNCIYGVKHYEEETVVYRFNMDNLEPTA